MAIPTDHKEIEKQEKRIGRYARKLNDDTTAIFYGCIEFDVPFYAAELAVGSRKPWESYLFNLQAADAEEKTHNRANGGFLAGELTMEAANARKELTAAEYRKRWGFSAGHHGSNEAQINLLHPPPTVSCASGPRMSKRFCFHVET